MPVGNLKRSRSPVPSQNAGRIHRRAGSASRQSLAAAWTFRPARWLP